MRQEWTVQTDRKVSENQEIEEQWIGWSENEAGRNIYEMTKYQWLQSVL